jgi:hypothetical protein
MALFDASLCQMLDGEAVPYETVTIDIGSLPEAKKRAKAWTETVEVRDGSWLLIKQGIFSAATFKPGEF